MNKRKGICIVTLKFPPLFGGDSTHTYYLSKLLAQRNFEVHVLTIQSHMLRRKELAERVFVHRLGLPASTAELERFGIKRIIYMASAFCKLLSLFKKGKFCLIHSHGWDPAWIAGVFSRLFKVPLVHTVHGIQKASREPTRTIFRILELSLLGLCAYNNARIIALTSGDRFEIARMGVPLNFICVIPNGVDAQEYSITDHGEFRRRYNIDSSDFMVLFVGRLHKEKGIDTLLLTAHEMPHVKFVLVGSGHMEDAYRSSVSKLGLRNVIFTGELHDEDLLHAYSSCNIFILPSIFEGMPYALLEAMCANKPVIASDLPNIKELVKDGFSGFLFEKSNHQALIERLNFAINHKSLMKKIGKNGQNYVAKNFSMETIINKIIEVYFKAGLR